MSLAEMNGPVLPAAAAQRRARWLALLVAGAFFMENLDGTVITTALPDIAAAFGVAPLDLGIGVSAYLLTLGVFIPISGWVAARFGARRVFAAALALFTLASLLCAMAGGVATFVAVRVLQGIGGAMMVPVGRQVVLRNTPKHQLVVVIATLTWPGLAAPVLGPPIGGFIATYANWRWIFYLNLPLGIAAFFLALWLVPRGNEGGERRPFDWTGFALGAAAMCCLAWGAEQLGCRTAWSQAAAFLLAGLLLLAVEVWHLRRVAHPLLDLDTLKVPTFSVTIFGGSVFRIAIGAVPFLLPLMFQIGFGMNAFHAGLLVIAVFAGNLAMKVAATSLLRRHGFRRLMLANGLANVLALLACALLTPDTPLWLIAAVLFAGGMTRSTQGTALNTIAFADVPQAMMPMANTVFSTAFQVAMGFGVGLGAVCVRLGHGVASLLGLQAVPAVDYRLAFLFLALVSLAALYDTVLLKRGAGDHVLQPIQSPQE